MNKKRRRSKMQQRIGKLMFSKRMETIILVLILLYACLVFVHLIFEDGYNDDLKLAMLWVEVFILIIFIIEISLKFFAFGIAFLKDWANIFDILIVVCCFILALIELAVPDLKDASFMRFRAILRLLRIVVMFRKMNEMRKISA